MHLTFLGTSAGVPTRSRNVTALALHPLAERKGWLLIDCGEGTQHQLLRSGLALGPLTAICITHQHGDHVLGLPGLLSTLSMNKRTAPLTLIAPQATLDWVAHSLTLTDSFLSFDLHTTACESVGDTPLPLLHGSVSLRLYPLSHRVPCWAYRIEATAKTVRLDQDRLQADGLPPGPDWGALKRGETVQYQGRSYRPQDYQLAPPPALAVVVGGDNDQPDLLTEAVQGAQLLVHEATYTQAIADRVGPAPMHTAARQLGEFAQRAGVPALIATHLSSRYAPLGTGPGDAGELLEEIRTVYTGPLWLAEDFAGFWVSAQGVTPA